MCNNQCMVLKRSKKQRKLVKQEPTVEPQEPYLLPPRDQLIEECWKEPLNNGDWLEIHTWYYPKKRHNSRRDRKLGDFYIAYWQRLGRVAGVNQRLIASADCRHHGTFHFHDELNDPDHLTRQDAQAIESQIDVNAAYDDSRHQIQEFASKIIRKERGQNHAN